MKPAPCAPASNVETFLDDLLRMPGLPTPSDEAIYTGGSAADFRSVGVDVLRSLIDSAGVAPDSRLIEIGSGLGRVAIPLTQWLGVKGRYVGIEVVRHAVEWCRTHVCPLHAGFEFLHHDIRNQYYNPGATLSVRDFDLPEETFDVAIFCSVFTHLPVEDIEAYIEALALRITPGGAIWGTWFLMDEDARAAVAAGRTTLAFRSARDGAHFLDDEARSTLAIAYEPDLVEELLRKHGFGIERSSLGDWCSRPGPLAGYQDFLLARKRA